MNAAVFLDRDNTLIHNDGDLGDPELVKLVQGASSAIASLRGLGYKIVVVSNQGGVARGCYAESDVDAVNQRIADLVKATSGATIDRFYYCPYHPEGEVDRYKREHPWRKPSPGMILQAAQDLHLDLPQSWTIGDQMRDAEAGAAAGTRTILLHDDAQEMTPLRITERRTETGATATPNFTARNLIEAVRVIAQQRKPETPEESRGRQQMARRQESARVAAQGAEATTAMAPPAAAAAAPSIPAPQADRNQPPPPESEASAGATATPPMRLVGSEPEPSGALPPPVSPPAPGDAASREPETLRQILQELRHQRGGAGDFSYIKAIGIILQMIALVCFLGALLMGQADDKVFLRWMLSGILVQLATIATMLFAK